MGILSFLYYFLYSFSLSLIDPVDASCINYMFPIWITLLAVPINGERMTAGKAISAVLGFAGMVVIVTNGDLTRLRLDKPPALRVRLPRRFPGLCFPPWGSAAWWRS